MFYSIFFSQRKFILNFIASITFVTSAGNLSHTRKTNETTLSLYGTNKSTITLFRVWEVFMCVCVCERERERERDWSPLYRFVHYFMVRFLHIGLQRESVVLLSLSIFLPITHHIQFLLTSWPHSKTMEFFR